MVDIWPEQTAILVKVGTSMVPAAAGMLFAEGLAMRTKMFAIAKCWAWLAGILLGLVTLCFLAGLVLWAWFDGVRNALQ